MDAESAVGLNTARVKLFRRLWPALLGVFLLVWLGPPLLAVALIANGLRHDYPDADQLLRAAPRAAVVGIVRVSGTPEHGRYLLRKYGFPSAFRGGAQGWKTTWQGGNGLAFARGNERLSGICGRFSAFEVCDLDYWKEK